ncbi:MAG: response regulator transcription factor [Alkalispirochaeta sp.]
MPRILVVEDEPDLNQMIADFLAHKGYTTAQAFDGSAAMRLLFQSPPDLVILDLNLPHVDGLDVARTITSQTSVPVIMATARGEEEDRLQGFQVGADDYVVKPFSLPELAMRVAAVLRRSKMQNPHTDTSGDPLVIVNDLVIDTEQHAVQIAGRPVHLTAAQFSILLRLARNPGRVFSRLQLLESFQHDSYEGYERTIDVHIKNIRKLIETDPGRPQRIVTVWGVGYRMERTS